MWVIANEFKVLKLEIEDALDIRVNLHCGQRTGFASQLEFSLLDMIQVEVRVACGMDEIACLQSRNLCHHLEQQGIRCNVERNTQEGVC